MYPNVHSSLVQGNESCITPGSKIYTVSFGAPRTLQLFNTKGPLQEQHHILLHGSVHSYEGSSIDLEALFEIMSKVKSEIH